MPKVTQLISSQSQDLSLGGLTPEPAFYQAMVTLFLKQQLCCVSLSISLTLSGCSLSGQSLWHGLLAATCAGRIQGLSLLSLACEFTHMHRWHLAPHCTWGGGFCHRYLMGVSTYLSDELGQQLTDFCLLFPQDLLSFSLKDGKWICCLYSVVHMEGSQGPCCTCVLPNVFDEHRAILTGLL